MPVTEFVTFAVCDTGNVRSVYAAGFKHRFFSFFLQPKSVERTVPASVETLQR